MKLTRLMNFKGPNLQSENLRSEGATSSEAEQILHLKRLLVTLKQQYEKSLHHLQVQLQTEQNQKVTYQKEIESLQNQLTMAQKLHEEELQALKNQQSALKDLLKKSQDDLKQFSTSSPDMNLSGEEANKQRVEQLERVIPYLRDRAEEANLETEQLREEFEKAQKKIKDLEQEIVEYRLKAQKEIDQLQQAISSSQRDDSIETVVSSTSSHQLRQELEVIKRNLIQGSQEAKSLEGRYVEVLNEKIGLENQCKQLQLQLEHQSSNLTAFQVQLHEKEDQRKNLEISLQRKEEEWRDVCQKCEQFQHQILAFESKLKEKEYIQDGYEQLKEEWKRQNEQLEDAVERRIQAEQHLVELEKMTKEQETFLHELESQLQNLLNEKRMIESDRDQLKTLLEESETRLKVAQQHLAKKVKESSLLSEKVEEQQANLSEISQNIEQYKTQIAQLQASLDLYQRQEKRLQEQLHDALKGNENQVTKWEEKYFRMYDKWQESENKIRELKKFEDKHHQMQALLANLGNFMGSSFNNPHSSFHANTESFDKLASSYCIDSAESPASTNKDEQAEERYDVFGMRQTQDFSKFNQS